MPRPFPNTAPVTYALPVVRGWLQQLQGVLDFDLEEHVEAFSVCTDGIPDDHNLAVDGGFQLSYDNDDNPNPVYCWMLADMAEAYSKGKIRGRGRVRLSASTWYLLEAVSEAAHAIYHAEDWSPQRLSYGPEDFDANGDGESQTWACWLHRGGPSPFSVGLLKAGGFHRDFVPAWTSYDSHLVVEHDSKCTDAQVDELADRFLFELAASTNMVFRRAEYSEYIEDLPGTDEAILVGEKALSIGPLPSGPGAVDVARLWLRGTQVDDLPSALIAHARAIEFVSTTVARFEAHERMRVLLAIREFPVVSAGFLDQVYMEAEQYSRARRNDAELFKATVQRCAIPRVVADALVGVLPEIVKKLRSDRDIDQQSGLGEWARVVYATRNSLVHAKSNYTPTGLEVPEDRLEGVLPSVQRVALMCIRWFMQQPAHVRAV